MNAEYTNLSGVGISSITVTIDKLRKVFTLQLSDNKLTHLPTNMVNLRKLQELQIEKHRLSARDVESIQQSFKKLHPNLRRKG